MLNSFKLAISSIWSNKVRSFLTMLGIIIGVAAVIILVGIVNGQMSSITESFTSMGTNRISVTVVNMSSRRVSSTDMFSFFDENSEYFDSMSPAVSMDNVTIKVGNENSNRTAVTGVAESYVDVLGYELEQGRFIQYADLTYRNKVAVLGYYPAITYYGSPAAAMGQSISINGENFTIVGVYTKQSSDSETLSEGGTDDYIYIPYTVAEKLGRSSFIGSYTFTANDAFINDISVVTTAIEDYLYSIMKNSDLYSVISSSQMLDQLNSMTTQMSVMLGGIAGISLLVAGVGVMNIMLVSVTERTREIGIRKSLGAKRGTIMQQFVIEAAMTSSLGGIVGILVGIAGCNLAGGFTGTDVTASFSAIVLSFSVSLAIGLIFGYMPAQRAAKLNPIDALRSD